MIVHEKHVFVRVVHEKHVFARVRVDRERFFQIVLFRTVKNCRRRNNISDFFEKLHCNISSRFRLNKRVVALLTR